MLPRTAPLAALFLFGASALSLPAQVTEPTRIDIDAMWPARTDTTAQAYLQWALNGSRNAGLNAATKTFDATPAGTITLTVEQTAPDQAAAPDTYLSTGWLNKNGIAFGYKMAFDGVWAHQKNDALSIDRPYLDGGALRLSISGLSAGTHTLTTYHNNIWGDKYGGVMSRCILRLNGEAVATVTPSHLATSDDEVAAAFLTFEAKEGEPVVLTLEPDHSGVLDAVILNGLEIDRSSPPGAVAIEPVPAHEDWHVAGGLDALWPERPALLEGEGHTTLSWTPASTAVSHDLYFGTSRDAVASAGRSSPSFIGNQTATSWEATSLNSSDTYYWRVDEVTAEGTVHSGQVWAFQLRHLAFPGAEGHGRFAKGGRGGRVIAVTNLLDYDTGAGEAVIPGSYRAAIEAKGPRTIVFKVSGLIRLKKSCPIASDRGEVTIAGQTAPGEGICLANYSAGLSGARDVIMRHLRERVGDLCQKAMDGIGMGASTDHSIVDHCSISWTLDEGTSSRDGRNITFQRNIVAEGLQHSYHYAAQDRSKYETHAFAGSISGMIGSYHHNLLAHCTDRNWSLAGGLTQDGKYAGWLDIRNNVVYNWTSRTTDGGVYRCNYVNNYYKPFPGNPYVRWLLKLDAINEDWGIPAYYMDGNFMEGNDFTDNWWGFYNGTTVAAMVKSDTPLFESHVTTDSAKEAFYRVLADVGANQPAQDVIDTRVIRETRTGTTTYHGTRANNYPNGYKQPPTRNYYGIIDTQTDVRDAVGSPNYPWPAYASAQAPVDTDEDGMPDYWERSNGSDPAVADNNADPDRDGFTALEDYLNFLAGPHATVVAGESLQIDLKALCANFEGLSFVAQPPALGTALLEGDGHTLKFQTDAAERGRCTLSFTATTTSGESLGRTIEVLIVAAAPELEPLQTTGTDSRLVNMSVRAISRGETSPLIVGFVVADGSRELLLRAMGPSLAPYLPGEEQASVLQNPRIDLHDASQAVTDGNDDWASDGKENMRQLFTRLGAFGPISDDSADAALSRNITGLNTAWVYASGDTRGMVLTELYDASETATGRLANISARTEAGPAEKSLIIGFVIKGDKPRTLLIRGIGPTLSRWNIANPMPDPVLEIFGAKGHVLFRNDNWEEGDVSALQAAFAKTYAFALDSGSKDAVLLVTLEPGLYTARVSDMSGETGEALIEAYDLEP